MSFYPTTDELPLFARPTVGENRRAGNPSASTPGALGEELKRDGIARVEATAFELAAFLRDAAKRISDERGYVTIDDVRDFAETNGLRAPSPYFWGAIFKGRGWVRVGEEKSRRPGKHSHLQPRWKFVG